MSLQGNLRDFAATEILQLVASQKKSGCLSLEWNTERAVLWVHEGRIVSTRPAGVSKDDPLLSFLLKTQRLSGEQYRGLAAIQKESNRDLEDLLVNGRYLDQQDLAQYLERQILDDLSRIVRWENGSYRFDPNTKWPHPPLVLMSVEGALIEAARRVDEQKRFVAVFKDPHQLIGVRDLPDPDDPLSDEERELFGIIDGLHTVVEIVEAAPLSEYETYEALQRLLDSKWIEFVGRRDPAASEAAAAHAEAEAPRTPRPALSRELAVAGTAIVLALALRFASSLAGLNTPRVPQHDVFAAAQVRDLRYALDLYRRENGNYPHRLEDLVEDRWISGDQLHLPGYLVSYRPEGDGQSYRLDLSPDR